MEGMQEPHCLSVWVNACFITIHYLRKGPSSKLLCFNVVGCNGWCWKLLRGCMVSLDCVLIGVTIHLVAVHNLFFSFTGKSTKWISSVNESCV